jgi:acetoin utilization protein AcuB
MENEQVRLVDLLDDMCDGKDVFFRYVRAAKDIMPNSIKTLTSNDTVEKCLKVMKENQIRHVPVINAANQTSEKQSFVGVISDRDLLRQISPYMGKIGEQESDQKAKQQNLGQIVTKDPISISPETPIPDILACLLDNHIDMVPVLANGKLVSLVTATDIIKLFVRLDSIRQLWSKKLKIKTRRLSDLLFGESPGLAEVLSSVLRTAQNFMTSHVVSLEGQDTVVKAIKVMREGKFRHIPIVDSRNTIKGIVSDRDVLLHLPFVRGQRLLQSRGFRDYLFEVYPRHPSLGLPLNHIMTPAPQIISPDAGLYEVAKKLYDLKISCLPVTDEEKKLLGIVTKSDVMKGLFAAYRLIEKSSGQLTADMTSTQEPAGVRS